MDAAKWKTLGLLTGVLVIAGILTAGVAMPLVLGGGIVARNEASRYLDTPCNLKESAPPQKTYLYARDGKTLLATLFSQDRQLVSLSKVPKYLQEALVATEDRRFYQHHGVDLRGLIRSAVSTSSGDTQGGSTLTMQYVKQIRYFQAGDDPKKQQAAIAQNLQRKIEDAKCALYFENTKHESKAEILDNYLNIAFFGENAYGIETAAETYFGVTVDRLTLAQSAMLVGLLRAPSAYDPFQYPAAAKARRDNVLQNLVAVGKLSQAQADQQKRSPISLISSKPRTVRQGCISANPAVKNAAFFCEYAQNWLQDVNKISDLDTGGYRIVTTLDPSIQNNAQDHMNDVVTADAGSTAVLPVVDPHTGDVLAMAASKTFGSGKGQTEQPIFTANSAYGASTYKLFAMLTALSTGVSPDQQLETVGNDGSYKPTQCTTVGDGVVNGDANVSYNAIESMTTAAQKSDNTYFVKLAETMFSCQLRPMVTLMRQLGMTGIDQKTGLPDDKGATWAKVVVDNQRAQQLVLGSIPTSPLELAGAYAAVADNGVYNTPSPILSITDSHGNDVPLKRTRGTQVLAPQVADQAVKILVGDTKGDGTSEQVFSKSWYGDNSSEISGKTGTADLTDIKKYKDKNGAIWFVGMTPDLVAAAGIINFDQPFTPSTGIKGMSSGEAYGATAAQVWIDALKPSLQGKDWTWPDPNDVNGVQVPDLGGKTPSEARDLLTPLGLKLSILGQADGLYCGSDESYDSIGYAGPSTALPGSTVTACLSDGSDPSPPPPPAAPPARSSGNGNNRSDRNGTTGGATGGTTGRTTGGRTTGGTTGTTTGRGTGGGGGRATGGGPRR